MELSEQVKAVGDDGETESKEDTREQQKQTRENRLCALRSRAVLKKQPLLSFYLKV